MVTKTDFVRQFAAETSVHEILAAAKKQKISLTARQIHRARHYLRQQKSSKDKQGLTPKQRSKVREISAGMSVPDTRTLVMQDEQMLFAILRRLGTTHVRSLLDQYERGEN